MNFDTNCGPQSLITFLGNSHVLENSIPRYLSYPLGHDVHINQYIASHLGETIYYHQYPVISCQLW